MLEQAFIDFGYTKEEYEKIRNSDILINYSADALSNNFEQITNFFQSKGFTNYDIIKMTIKFPSLFTLTVENIKGKYDDMKSFGFSEEQLIAIIKLFPKLFSYSSQSIINKFDQLKKFRYSQNAIMLMIRIHPALISYDIENIKQKLEAIESLGYKKEEVTKMTTEFPQLFSLSIENIGEKTKFYDSIGMHSLAVIKPKYNMQSVKLSYARYMFLKRRGKVIDMTNYSVLFVNNKQFERMYGITSQELLDMYNYEELLKEERKNERTI